MYKLQTPAYGRGLEFIHFVSVRPVRDGMNLARHFSRPLEFAHFVGVRPVRDGMNLARHFSAGTGKGKQISPVGTIEWSPHG